MTIYIVVFIYTLLHKQHRSSNQHCYIFIYTLLQPQTIRQTPTDNTYHYPFVHFNETRLLVQTFQHTFIPSQLPNFNFKFQISNFNFKISFSKFEIVFLKCKTNLKSLIDSLKTIKNSIRNKHQRQSSNTIKHTIKSNHQNTIKNNYQRQSKLNQKQSSNTINQI